MGKYTLHHADCIKCMASMPENTIDSIITDPPYELGFMGRGWDASGIAYNVEMWGQALRVAKPGAILLAFGGTRTFHRVACAIEDAGWIMGQHQRQAKTCLSSHRWEAPYRLLSFIPVE